MNSPSAQRCNGWAFFHRAYLALCAAAILLRADGDSLALAGSDRDDLPSVDLAPASALCCCNLSRRTWGIEIGLKPKHEAPPDSSGLEFS